MNEVRVLMIDYKKVVALVVGMERKSGSHFGALTNIAIGVGTKTGVGNGGKITWWEQWKIHMHRYL